MFVQVDDVEFYAGLAMGVRYFEEKPLGIAVCVYIVLEQKVVFGWGDH